MENLPQTIEAKKSGLVFVPGITTRPIFFSLTATHFSVCLGNYDSP